MKYFLFICFSFPLLMQCSISKQNKVPKAEIVKFSIQNIDAQIDQKNQTIILSARDIDLQQRPIIETSNGGKVTPQSDEPINFSSPVKYTVTSTDKTSTTYTVYLSSTAKPFFIRKKKYEILTEAMTWEEASKVAKERGGYLAHVNSETEQIGVYNAAQAYQLDKEKTIAPDGGGAAYLWLGGTDINKEGHWVWDGSNSGQGEAFWEGKVDGKSINNQYTNWGKEPDDYLNNQDALGLALTDWPLGKKSQWNDIDKMNKLFFVIEFD